MTTVTYPDAIWTAIEIDGAISLRNCWGKEVYRSEANGTILITALDGEVELATSSTTRAAKARIRFDSKTGEYDVLVRRHDGTRWTWEVEWSCESPAEAEEMLREEVLPRLRIGEFEEWAD